MIVFEVTEIDGVVFEPVDNYYNHVYISKRRIGLLHRSGVFYSSVLGTDEGMDQREFRSLKQLAKYIATKVLTELI